MGKKINTFHELIRLERDIGQIDPHAYLYDETFAECWKRMRATALDLAITELNTKRWLDLALKKNAKPRDRRQLREDLKDLLQLSRQSAEDTADFHLIVGFCLGLRAYRQKIKMKLDALNLEVIEEHNMWPKPPAAERSDLFTIRGRDGYTTIRKRKDL
jgi:hypothetical protein